MRFVRLWRVGQPIAASIVIASFVDANAQSSNSQYKLQEEAFIIITNEKNQFVDRLSVSEEDFWKQIDPPAAEEKNSPEEHEQRLQLPDPQPREYVQYVGDWEFYAKCQSALDPELPHPRYVLDGEVILHFHQRIFLMTRISVQGHALLNSEQLVAIAPGIGHRLKAFHRETRFKVFAGLFMKTSTLDFLDLLQTEAQNGRLVAAEIETQTGKNIRLIFGAGYRSHDFTIQDRHDASLLYLQFNDRKQRFIRLTLETTPEFDTREYKSIQMHLGLRF